MSTKTPHAYNISMSEYTVPANKATETEDKAMQEKKERQVK